MEKVSDLYYLDRKIEIENESGLLQEGSFRIIVKDNNHEIIIQLWKLNQFGGIQESETIRVRQEKIDNHIKNLLYIWQNNKFLDYLQLYHEIKIIQKNY